MRLRGTVLTQKIVKRNTSDGKQIVKLLLTIKDLDTQKLLESYTWCKDEKEVPNYEGTSAFFECIGYIDSDKRYYVNFKREIKEDDR